MNKIGTKVNGEETIFLMIASYRDFQCRETITSAYNRSDHPERLYVGAVDQVVPGDIGCLDVDPPCSVNPDQPVCKYRDQISVFKMDAKYATGKFLSASTDDGVFILLNCRPGDCSPCWRPHVSWSIFRHADGCSLLVHSPLGFKTYQPMEINQK